MSGLLLILTAASGDQFDAAVELAASKAALGHSVAVLLRGAVTGELSSPNVRVALEMMRDVGANIAVCQTALAHYDLQATSLPDYIEPIGMIAALQGRADWQILLV